MAQGSELACREQKVLGSILVIQLPAGAGEGVFGRCFAEAKRIEQKFSRFLPDSELCRLNANLGVWQDASEEYLHLLGRAQEFYEKSGGRFDVSLKADLERLGYDPSYSFRRKGGRAKDFEDESPAYSIDERRGQVALFREVELGGLGKGYALDRIAQIIDAAGLQHYCINAGGDIYARRGAGELPWRVLLEHPGDPKRAMGEIALDGQAIAASAPNRRKWGDGLHHLLDAKTGEPVTGVKATFIVAKTGIEADAYSTAIFTAGFEGAVQLCKTLPVQAMVISGEDKVFRTDGFDAKLF